MHDCGAFTWREVVDRHHSALLDELNGQLDAELGQAVSQAVANERSNAGVRLEKACGEAVTAQAENLNQLLRRLRTTAENDVPALVARSVAPYTAKLVVVVFENNQARVAATHGTAEHSLAISIDVNASPAIAAAIDSRDPVIALATPAEISSDLAQLFSEQGDVAADQKAYLFPVIVRQSVVAMLIASMVETPAPVELLCEAAGMRLESFVPAAASLVAQAAFAGVSSPEPGTQLHTQEVPASATSAPRSWDELTAEDQKLHLQAQRMARVRVAEMRLYQPNELRRGVESGDIYGSLQDAIDAARTQFLQNFLSKSPTMVDYLHLEIMRSLAHEDDRLLGHSYPGPMV